MHRSAGSYSPYALATPASLGSTPIGAVLERGTTSVPCRANDDLGREKVCQVARVHSDSVEEEESRSGHRESTHHQPSGPDLGQEPARERAPGMVPEGERKEMRNIRS